MIRVAFWLWVLSCVACSGTGHTDGSTASDAQVEDGDAGEADAEDAEPGGEEPDAGMAVSDDAGPGGICSTCGGCEETREVTSANHKPEPISYADNPPTGGDHASCWSSFGVHSDAVPEARWVHNLEHGAIVFLYNCQGDCSADIKQLEALAKGRAFALVTPDARLPTRFAVVAWGVRLLSDCLDPEAFAAFYSKHVDRAGESSSSGPPGGC